MVTVAIAIDMVLGSWTIKHVMSYSIEVPIAIRVKCCSSLRLGDRLEDDRGERDWLVEVYRDR